MKNKIIIAIVSIIAIMVSIIAYVQVLPFIEQYQKEIAFKEKMKEKNQCIDQARAEAVPGEAFNDTKWNECMMGRYDT